MPRTGRFRACSGSDAEALFGHFSLATDSDSLQGQYIFSGRSLTDYLADQAVAAIEANQKNPFFLYMAFTAVHTPLSALKTDYDSVSHLYPSWSHCDKVYGAMLLALDRGVGKILDSLRRLDIDKNTMVVFTSDNGGPGVYQIAIC